MMGMMGCEWRLAYNGYVHNITWMLQIQSQISIHSYLKASELVGVKGVLVSNKGYSYRMR